MGTRSFQRGRAFARSRRVRNIAWDADDETLTGSVVGNGGLYETAAFFASEPDGVLTFGEGECTCPVGYDCKHVAALVIAASTHGLAFRPAGRARPQPAAATAPSWEAPLLALVRCAARARDGQPAGGRAGVAHERHRRPGGAASDGAPDAAGARAAAGSTGRWRGTALDPWRVRRLPRRPRGAGPRAARRPARAAARARYYYGYGADKTLDLSDCDSAQLWSLLEEAERIGIGAHPRAQGARRGGLASARVRSCSTSPMGRRRGCSSRRRSASTASTSGPRARCCSSGSAGTGWSASTRAPAARSRIAQLRLLRLRP